MLDAAHTIITGVHVFEELLTSWKYYCVGESESEEDSREEEKKKKKRNTRNQEESNQEKVAINRKG